MELSSAVLIALSTYRGQYPPLLSTSFRYRKKRVQCTIGILVAHRTLGYVRAISHDDTRIMIHVSFDLLGTELIIRQMIPFTHRYSYDTVVEMHSILNFRIFSKVVLRYFAVSRWLSGGSLALKLCAEPLATSGTIF